VTQGDQGGAADGHAAAFAAFAQHMGFSGIEVHPAGCAGAGVRVQAQQFGTAQAAAVEQFDHGVVACVQPGGFATGPCGGGRRGGALARIVGLVRGQGHGLVHRQGFGQGLGCLGRLDALDRVQGCQPLSAQPLVQAAPGCQGDGDAARSKALGVQTGSPAAHVVGAHGGEAQSFVVTKGAQTAEGLAIHGQGAFGQSALDAQMVEVAHQQRVWRRCRCGSGQGRVRGGSACHGGCGVR
jgi:hypothetical protein